jgi:ferric-dicitrate binding protein FerR (iron transport regulator)
MENNNPNDELLIEYLVSDLTTDEKAIVENWIKASEENRRYFERLKHAWQLSGEEKTLNYVLDELNVDDKWSQIKQAIDGRKARVVAVNDEGQDEREKHDQSQGRKPGVYRFLVRVAIAASVLLVLGLGWVLFFQNKQETPVARNTEKNTDSVAFVVRHEVNTTGKEKRIQLPDGSLIVLANNSEVTYREPFTNGRNITLKGKAFFKVAKDKTKPFTVFSGAISTTALGTEFTVTTVENKNQIIVRLYEGKVVVKSVNKTNKTMENDVYLLPGQAFVYGGQTRAKVKEFKVDNAVAPEQIMNKEQAHDDPSLPENEERSYFMFNNQPLAQVFDDLEGLYNVTIIYDKKDIQNLYFIGKYSNADSLETILKRIATLNNLTVTKKDNAYIIGK